MQGTQYATKRSILCREHFVDPQCFRLLKSCMLRRKVIYVKCINYSYNKVAKGIRLLDKKAISVYTGKLSCK